VNVLLTKLQRRRDEWSSVRSVQQSSDRSNRQLRPLLTYWMTEWGVTWRILHSATDRLAGPTTQRVSLTHALHSLQL